MTSNENNSKMSVQIRRTREGNEEGGKRNLVDIAKIGATCVAVVNTRQLMFPFSVTHHRVNFTRQYVSHKRTTRIFRDSDDWFTDNSGYK